MNLGFFDFDTHISANIGNRAANMRVCKNRSVPSHQIDHIAVWELIYTPAPSWILLFISLRQHLLHSVLIRKYYRYVVDGWFYFTKNWLLRFWRLITFKQVAIGQTYIWFEWVRCKIYIFLKYQSNIISHAVVLYILKSTCTWFSDVLAKRLTCV